MRRVHARVEDRDGVSRAVVACGPCLIGLNQWHALGEDGSDDLVLEDAHDVGRCRVEGGERSGPDLERHVRNGRVTHESRGDRPTAARPRRARPRIRCRAAARERQRRFEADPPARAGRSEDPTRRSRAPDHLARRARVQCRALVVPRPVVSETALAPTERCRRARKTGGPRLEPPPGVEASLNLRVMMRSSILCRSNRQPCQAECGRLRTKDRNLTRWVVPTRSSDDESEIRHADRVWMGRRIL